MSYTVGLNEFGYIRVTIKGIGAFDVQDVEAWLSMLRGEAEVGDQGNYFDFSLERKGDTLWFNLSAGCDLNVHLDDISVPFTADDAAKLSREIELQVTANRLQVAALEAVDGISTHERAKLLKACESINNQVDAIIAQLGVRDRIEALAANEGK